MTTVPTLTVEIAFTTDPFSTPTWVDVTDYAIAASTRRGKGKVLGHVPAGTCSVTLDNVDGRFDPNYTSGAYYPNVKPFRRIRLRATTTENLLSENQASLETGTTGWQAFDNCAIARSTAQADHGSASLEVTTTAAGTATPGTLRGASGVAVTAGQTYTAMASVLTPSGATTARVYVTWFDAGGAALSDAIGPTVGTSTSAWTSLTVEATAPASAAFVSVQVQVFSTATAEVSYVDKAGLYAGSVSAWTLTGVFGLFSGFITSWPQAYEWPEIATVTVDAVDGFQILNLRSLTASYSQELSGTRVSNVLDSVSWPAGDRNVDAGESTVQNVTLTDGNPLEHLQKVADSENGLLFVDRDGNLRFRSRHGLISGAFDDAGHTFGDPDAAAGAIEISDLSVNYDDLDIWNDVRVSSQGVAIQTATDADSQAAYLVRTLERTGLLLTSTDEQQSHATYLLTGYREPALRVDDVTHSLLMDATDWQAILDRDLGDKVRVAINPPGGGTILQRSFVESVSWTIQSGRDGDRWRCKWGLTPATRRVDFWLAGDSVQSLAGQTTRGAY